jgi:hypothetical protein
MADDPSGMPQRAILNGTSNHARLFVQVIFPTLFLVNYVFTSPT